ncbi:alpha/beta fold hydrolase [Kineococcus sp. SYSU DK018]|uniref:alpha/beta fold hydrolase n=1 Tax=Kineococcus sp. SYSU DK018 TaxID=3383139 RepID=UPI003D7D1A3D
MAQAHHAAGRHQRAAAAATVYAAPGAFAPLRTCAGLAAADAPVLLVAGEFDVNSPVEVVRHVAALLPLARVVVQEGAGHLPWLDDGPRFVQAVTDFLAS